MPMLEVKGLVKRFGGNVAVDHACFTVEEKGVTCLIGPNGSGKTTIFNLLTNMLPADEGSALYRGGELIGKSASAVVKRGVVRTFQDLKLFGEFTVRHPENKNAELLWHCGPFAYSLKKEGCPCKNVNMRQWFQVRDGQYTVARFDQDDGDYRLLAGTCKTTEGPYTFGTYLWGEFANLPAWERKLVEGPYIHHMAEIEGDWTQELREFCKFVPALTADAVNE